MPLIYTVLAWVPAGFVSWVPFLSPSVSVCVCGSPSSQNTHKPVSPFLSAAAYDVDPHLFSTFNHSLGVPFPPCRCVLGLLPLLKLLLWEPWLLRLTHNILLSEWVSQRSRGSTTLSWRSQYTLFSLELPYSHHTLRCLIMSVCGIAMACK